MIPLMNLHLTMMLILLSACGVQSVLKVGAVHPRVTTAFEELRAELAAEAGYDVLQPTGGGVWIVADAQRIAARSQETGGNSGGFWNPALREIVLPPPDEPLVIKGGEPFVPTKAYYAVLMAHEIGHAMGLATIEHDDAGLMSATLPSECIGRAAVCLLDALAIPRVPTPLSE